MCKGGKENLPCPYLKKKKYNRQNKPKHPPHVHIYCQASQGAWLAQRCDFEEPFQAGGRPELAVTTKPAPPLASLKTGALEGRCCLRA